MKALLRRPSILSSCLLVLLTPGGAAAEDNSTTLLESFAMESVEGILALNMAAGSEMAQFNAVALSIGVGADAVSVIEAYQRISAEGLGDGYSGTAVARIGVGAVSGATGLVTVNQASGQGNAQANAVAIATGIGGEALADSVLGQSFPDADPVQGGAQARGGYREAAVEAGAFDGARGVVQVNQAAGARNATSNALAVRVTVK